MITSSPDINKNFQRDLSRSCGKTGVFHSVTRSLSPITDIWWRSPAPDWSGKPENSNIIFAGESADVDFSKTMGIKIL
jgi:hypothetical protein